jgi:type II secretory pathway component PulM
VLSLLAATPALPLDEAGKYVAGAYVVFLALIVVYVAIMAAKLQRIERELRELTTFAEARAGADQAAPAPEEVGADV